MDIITETQNGATVIKLSGSLDAVTTPDFDTEWKSRLDGGATKIVVDLAGVDYISSAGLRGVLMLAKTAKGKNASVAFCGMQSMVADMFKLSGFSSILALYPDVAAALTA